MRGGLINVVIADDHTLFRNGLKNYLQTLPNFNLLFDAENGDVLIKKISSSALLPDICILDINMPVKDGIKTCTDLLSEWPSIKVLALSVGDNEYDIIQMLKAGARGFISKSAEPEQLRDALLRVHVFGRYEDGSIPTVDHAVSVDDITQREKEFLRLCCSDHSYKEIAGKMGISIRTVESYRDSVYKKVHVNSRVGLVLYAVKLGMIG